LVSFLLAVLNGATVFANDHGMAPGMGVNKNGKVYILLPGPPSFGGPGNKI
jgi:molybdopterin-biosynthesis enzyme MoeA-like protein